MSNAINLLANAIAAVNAKVRDAEKAEKKSRAEAEKFVAGFLRRIKTDFTIDVTGPKGAKTMHVFGGGKARATRIKRAAEAFVRSGSWLEDELADRLVAGIHVAGRRLVNHASGRACACGTVLIDDEMSSGRCRFCQLRALRIDTPVSAPPSAPYRWELTGEETAARGRDAQTKCPVCTRGFVVSDEVLRKIAAIPSDRYIERIKETRDRTGLGLGESKYLVHCAGDHLTILPE